jgi:hypothetical protein
MDLQNQTDREIMVMLLEMENAYQSLTQNIQLVRAEWQRRVEEEKRKNKDKDHP